MEPFDIISSGILELYATGAASPEECHNVEAWVKQYPEVAAELAAIEAAMESYARTNAIQPGSAVKGALFKKIQAPDPSPSVKAETIRVKVYSISPTWKYAAAASIILLVGSILFNYSYYNKYNDASDQLQATQKELQEQKTLAKAMHDDMGVMTDKYALPVSLDPMPDVPDAAARIYWMKNTGDVYIDPSNLPQAPNGMQYQFWAIIDGKPVSGGMITTLKDGKTVHVQKMKSFGKAQAFAVSLEKAGPESTTPTKVYVMGKI